MTPTITGTAVSDRRRAAILIGTVLSVAAFMVAGPMRSRSAETGQLMARAALLEESTRHDDADTLRQRLDSLSSVLGAARHDIMALEAQLPSPAELPLLLGEIVELARRSSISVQSIVPHAPIADTPLVHRSYDVSVAGPIRNIQRFVQGLTALPRSLGLDALELETLTATHAKAALQLRTATVLGGEQDIATLRDTSNTRPLMLVSAEPQEVTLDDDGAVQSVTELSLTLLAILHAGHTTPVRAVLRDSTTGQRWTVGVGDRIGEHFVHDIKTTAVILARSDREGWRTESVEWPPPNRFPKGVRTIPAEHMPPMASTTRRGPLP